MHVRTQSGMALSLLVLLSGLAACSDGQRVSPAIEKAVDGQKAGEIRLAESTRFQWDSLYLFGSYTPREDICTTLRIEPSECPRHLPFVSVDEAHSALVFTSSGRLVHLEQHAHSKGDFHQRDYRSPPSQALTPQTAVFRIVRERTASTGEFRVRLIPK